MSERRATPLRRDAGRDDNAAATRHSGAKCVLAHAVSRAGAAAAARGGTRRRYCCSARRRATAVVVILVVVRRASDCGG